MVPVPIFKPVAPTNRLKSGVWSVNQPLMTDSLSSISVDGRAIAFHQLEGKIPGIIFMGGFKSDMTGTKALALEEVCRRRNRAFIRFDYSGHGQSEGAFEDGTISQWAADAIAVLDQVAVGPQIVVGSSMGGWIALLAARARPDRIAALVGIAAAPDFTEDLMWAGFDETIRQTIMNEGVYYEPSDYDDEPYTITRALIEDGRDNLVLRDPLPLPFPVRLIQGMQDADVPWQHALRLAEHATCDDLELMLVKNGDHRLSTPEDLARLEATLDVLLVSTS